MVDSLRLRYEDPVLRSYEANESERERKEEEIPKQ